MTTVAGNAPLSEQSDGIPRPRFGLSGRVILLTLAFIVVAEFLIYVPAVVGYRQAKIAERLLASQVIALALTVAPEGRLPNDLETKLLARIEGARSIAVLTQTSRRVLVEAGGVPTQVSAEIDLRQRPWIQAFAGFVGTIRSAPDDLLRIISAEADGIPGASWVELTIRQEPLRDSLLAFSRNFFFVSLVILGALAGLLYLALHVLVIAPVRRLSTNIARFAQGPEDESRIIRPSGRTDEIGTAESALARMESSLAGELRQKRRLADLGLAVSKINHELRNMLTTAQLLGDRLSQSADPAVRRIAPRLIRTVDRAIAFCTATLAYGRVVEPAPVRTRFKLKPLVIDQLEQADGNEIAVEAGIPADLEIDADREQLGRALLNLCRNAAQALLQAGTPSPAIRVTAGRAGGEVWIRVADNGPGIPPRSRARLFSAFQASESSGGTGLGLPVADELVRQHGGSITLEDAAVGASFLIRLPDPVG